MNSEDITWCHEIDKDILLLTHYIKEVKTRITIFQIIDTVIDPLLAIKRVLIGVLLKEKKSVNVGSGIIQSPFLNVESWRGSSHAQKSSNSNYRREHNKSSNIDASYYKEIYNLVSSYLDLLSNILLICKTQEALKLICELFIKDRQWQESIEIYTTQLFKFDLLNDIQKRMLHIDEPKTIINMDESIFDMNLASTSKSQDKNVNVNIAENIESIKNSFETV